MIWSPFSAFALAVFLLSFSGVFAHAEEKLAASPTARASGGAGVNNPAAAPALKCAPIPTKADAIKALAQHVPSLRVTPASTIIPDDEPITLHLAFPTNLAMSAVPDFGVVGTLDGQSGAASWVFRIVSWKASSSDSKAGDLVIAPVPGELFDGVRWRRLHLFVAACSADRNARLDTGTADSLVSTRLPGVLAAAAITIFLYVFGAFTISVPTRGWRRLSPRLLSPRLLAVDGSGRASLSNLQIIFFSVIVLYLVSYILLRTGVLAGLSEDVLLLLGIAGVGSVGGKLATINTQRLSFDNWAWAKRKGWTTVEGYHVNSPHWSDFFTTNDDFDPYKFQMLSFSFIIGISLLMTGLNRLVEFTIPTALLALIGLSQATYIGGKIVAPPNFSDLDNKLTELRKAQEDFLTSTADKWVPATTPGTLQRAAQLSAAEADNRAKYLKFQSLAGPAYTMFEELFVAKGATPNREPDP